MMPTPPPPERDTSVDVAGTFPAAEIVAAMIVVGLLALIALGVIR